MFTDLGSLLFFSAAQAYIRREFIDFMNGAYANMLSLLAFVITTLMTIWVLVHGFRIMTGRSGEPLMGFILKAGKAMVICSIAVSAGLFGSSVQDWLLGDGTSSNVGLRGAITETVTGSNDDPYSQVNENLRLTQVILTAMNTLTSGGQGQIEGNSGSSSMWMSGFGQAGPAVVGGVLILLNEIGFYLGLMFSPLMILSLLSEQTKQFFWGWLKYMVALCFSMAVLVLVTSIALKMTITYGTAVVAASLLTSVLGQVGSSNSMAATAMQQGGLGMLLTALIISVPPMVMQFFSAQLGAVGTGQNMMGSLGQPPKTSNPTMGNPTSTNHNTQNNQTTPSTSNHGGFEGRSTQAYTGSNSTPKGNGDTVKSSGESRGAAASGGANNNSPIAQLGQNIRQSMGLDGGTTGQAAKADAGSANPAKEEHAAGLKVQTPTLASSAIGDDSAAVKQKHGTSEA